jgi:hypothetical protein
MKKKYDWLSFFDLWGLQCGTNESRVGIQKIKKKFGTVGPTLFLTREGGGVRGYSQGREYLLFTRNEEAAFFGKRD